MADVRVHDDVAHAAGSVNGAAAARADDGPQVFEIRSALGLDLAVPVWTTISCASSPAEGATSGNSLNSPRSPFWNVAVVTLTCRRCFASSIERRTGLPSLLSASVTLSTTNFGIDSFTYVVTDGTFQTPAAIWMPTSCPFS